MSSGICQCGNVINAAILDKYVSEETLACCNPCCNHTLHHNNEKSQRSLMAVAGAAKPIDVG